MLTRKIWLAHPQAGARPATLTALVAPPFWLWSLGLSLLLAGALLWPLPAHIHTHTIDTGDALHLAWSVRWTQATLLGQAAPFSAPAGYPHAEALLFNPPLYAMDLIGLPLYELGWSASAVYNGLVLLSFALSCWAAALLSCRGERCSSGRWRMPRPTWPTATSTTRWPTASRSSTRP